MPKSSPLILALALLSLSLGLSGCTTKRLFAEKYQDNLFSANYDPHLDGKLRTDGYYLYYNDSIHEFVSDNYYDPTYHPSLYHTYAIYLQPDGTFVYEDFTHEDHKSFNLKSQGRCYRPDAGGIYSLIGDSLYADVYQVFQSGFFDQNSKWEINKYVYEIIDKETLRLSRIIHADGDVIDRYDVNNDRKYVFKFVPFTDEASRKDPEIKDKKWMWVNKDDWEAYKRELNEYKKKCKEEEKKNQDQQQQHSQEDQLPLWLVLTLAGLLILLNL